MFSWQHDPLPALSGSKCLISRMNENYVASKGTAARYPDQFKSSFGFLVTSRQVALRLRSGSRRSLSGVEAVPQNRVEVVPLSGVEVVPLSGVEVQRNDQLSWARYWYRVMGESLTQFGGIFGVREPLAGKVRESANCRVTTTKSPLGIGGLWDAGLPLPDKRERRRLLLLAILPAYSY
jgi:hypothetical protein